jgi:hypothetical protein
VDKSHKVTTQGKQINSYKEFTMSAIANFKQRQLKKQAEQKKHAEKVAEQPKNQALTLLAKLLNVAEQDAISEATKYIESNITFFNNDENTDAKKGGDGVKTNAEPSSENENVLNQAASNVEDAASDLAYSASDITNATEELKEVAKEVKKPSRAARKSSTGAKKSKAKASSKK